MKKILSLLLILVLAVSLAACKADPQKELVGEWEAEIDLAPYLTSAIIAKDVKLHKYLELSSLPAAITLKIDEDGSYLRSAQAAFTAQQIQDLKQDLIDAYNAYYTAYAKKIDEGMTLESFLAQTKISPEWKAEQIANEQTLQIMVRDLDFAGSYLFAEGNLYMDRYEDVKLKTNPHTYTLEGKRLTFEKAGAPSEFEQLYYPITFKKK